MLKFWRQGSSDKLMLRGEGEPRVATRRYDRIAEAV